MVVLVQSSSSSSSPFVRLGYAQRSISTCMHACESLVFWSLASFFFPFYLLRQLFPFVSSLPSRVVHPSGHFSLPSLVCYCLSSGPLQTCASASTLSLVILASALSPPSCFIPSQSFFFLVQNLLLTFFPFWLLSISSALPSDLYPLSCLPKPRVRVFAPLVSCFLLLRLPDLYHPSFPPQ